MRKHESRVWSELADDITTRLHANTACRIRHLRFEPGEDKVVVSGVVPTYYAKQLALHALMERLGAGFNAHYAIDVA